MYSFVSTLVHVSRPHIWLYTMGPFSFGVLVAMAKGYTVSPTWFLLWLLLLSVPINLFIYGVNDYFDAATDVHNPKKDTLEYRAGMHEYRLLGFAVLGLFCLLLNLMHEPALVWLLGSVWLLLVLTYNMPPLRFKARPILDLLLAFNYPLLGIIGYVMVTGYLPTFWIILPITLLAVSFHVFSAIHDMPHDKADHIITTALWLESAERALRVCAWCALAAAASFLWIGWWLVGLSLLPYAAFFSAHLYNAPLRNDALRSYTYFIRLQYIVGFCAVGSSLWYLGFFAIL